MWLQCHDRLLPIDRSVKWGITVETKCLFYPQEGETRDHIYVCVVVVGACGPDNSTECPPLGPKAFNGLYSTQRGRPK